jgi:hypothetical protein
VEVSISASLTALQAAWQTRIDALTDDATKAEAGVALEDYIAAKTAHSAAVADRLTSYSIQGRSATRRDPDQLQQAADQAMARLAALCGGGYQLANCSEVPV